MPTKYNVLTNNDRTRIVQSYLSQNSISDISKVMNIKRTTVHEVIKSYIRTGSAEKLKRGKPHKSKLNDEQIAQLREWIDENCTISLKMLSQKCLTVFNVSVTTTTVAKYIQSFCYSLKRLQLIPARRNDEKSLSDRREYSLKFLDLTSEYDELIFIDEVGFNVSMRTSRGRALIGSSANITVPNIRSRNISICCAISKNGIITYMSKNCAFNAEHFTTFINQLATNLEELNLEKVVVIMDNVKFHKTVAVKNHILEKGFHLEYLPPYSPFLNPIENMFSKWKEYTKRHLPNNEEELMHIIENGKTTINSSDCVGFYKNMMKYIRKCVNGEKILD